MTSNGTSKPSAYPSNRALCEPAQPRQAVPLINTDLATARFIHTITCSEITDTVQLRLGRLRVLPIVLVPGIMGSNLRTNDGKKESVWRVDSNLGLLNQWGFTGAGERQRLLHPKRTELDPNGDVPTDQVGGLRDRQQFLNRGWGEVSAASYQEFLIWLEVHLNGGRRLGDLNTTLQQVDHAKLWRPQKPFVPLDAEECASAQRWSYPVYACGYNWLECNSKSALRLRDRIDTIIQQNNRGRLECEQVILLTHSMGGLVSRACCQLPVAEGGFKTMECKIAGVVHCVMPANGAVAAYTRTKAGMQDETASGLTDGDALDWGVVRVLGITGKEVTAVFAQAPGALQLLPNKRYPTEWLQIRDSDGALLPEQPSTGDPYETIYKERYRWWGLVKEEWLSPPKGEPIEFAQDFIPNVTAASTFHEKIQDYYHPNTWGFYGQGLGSYERAVWTLTQGNAPQTQGAPRKKDITALNHSAMREEGFSTIGVAATDERIWRVITRQHDYFYLRLPVASTMGSGTGDGTVGVASARAPVASDNVKQLFCLRNIAHEACLRNSMDARYATVYAINKIAAPLPIGHYYRRGK